MPKFLRISKWEKHYENNRSRELRRPEWLPLPNKFDGSGFMELMDHPAGMSHYGAWCLLLAAASRMPCRGTLVSDSGKPLTVKDIARMTRGSVRAFEEALPRLVAIGWVEEIDDKSPVKSDENANLAAPSKDAGGLDDALKSQPSAGIPQQGAALVRLNKKGNENEKVEVVETREDRPPTDHQDIFSPGGIPAKLCRSKTLGDLEACFPRLIVLREDRGKAEATLALFGWEACAEGLRELGPIANKRPSNRRRIFVSELSAWLNANFTPEPEDYQRAGLPIPEGKT